MIDLRKIFPYKNEALVLAKHQTTGDIIDGMLDTHNLYAKQYDKVSDNFWRGDAESTARGIYDYLKDNVKYSVEPYTDQTVKSPGAIVHERYGDCKHYAQFAMGVVDSLRRKGYPVSGLFRFVSYDRKERVPYHVFAVMRDQYGNEIWIDPCIGYDEKLKFIYKRDEKPRKMFSSISGTQPGVVAPAINISNRDAVRSLVTWLQLNLFRLSERLQADKKAYQSMLQRFIAAGGSKPVFDAAINQGVNFYRQLHQDKLNSGQMMQLNEYGYDVETAGMIGIDPVTLTSLITAGSSIATAALNSGKSKNSGPSVKLDDTLYNAVSSAIRSGKPLSASAIANVKSMVSRYPGKYPMLEQLVRENPGVFGSSGTFVPVPPASQVPMNPAATNTGGYSQNQVPYNDGTYNPGNVNMQTGTSTGTSDWFDRAKLFVDNNKTLVFGTTAALIFAPRILDALSGKRRR